MKVSGKIALLLMMGIAGGFGQCIVNQIVRNLPIADVNGVHWTIYDLADPEARVVVESDPSCMTFPALDGLLWAAELMYWSPPPEVGDMLIIIGSWDSAYVNDPVTYGDNPNHTGFYWLYSDSVDDVALTEWEDDTLRPISPPVVTQVGGPTGDIQISITNPAQTLSGTGTYDVLGFWIWADTTGHGWPDSFDMEVGFASVNGGAGGTTIYNHPVSNYHNNQTVYWAYKLVARPSFSLKGSRQAPGYSTHYFSQNSDPIVIIGIEETQIFNPKPLIPSLELYPNPFKYKTEISLSIGQGTEDIELKIYDVSGRIVKDFSRFTLDAQRPTILSWDGRDNSGKEVRSGVYFCRFIAGDHHLTKKLLLLR